MIKKVDAVLLPYAGPNVIHELDPILADNRLEHVITGNKPKGRILKENFKSFIQSYQVKHIEAKNGWQFIPAKQCTCTVYRQDNKEKWYERGEPAVLQFSFGKTQLLINGTNKTLSGMLPNDASIRIDNDISLFTNHKQIKGSGSGLSFSTEEDGADTKQQGGGGS